MESLNVFLWCIIIIIIINFLINFFGDESQELA
jgi:hypothetical protein